ncbi:MAG: acyltransferase [Bacteriovoracaceae bacterium]
MKKPVPKILDLFFSFYSIVLYFTLVTAFFSPFSPVFKLLIFVFVIYIQPPLIWRLLHIYYGPVPKVSYLGVKTDSGNLWYLAHKLQEPFETFQVLERFLRTIPGLYSSWLRLWGAQIGKKVNWTSGCKLVDRPHIHIGDRSLIGNMSYLSAHAIKKKDNKYILYVKDVLIGNDVVISYSVTIAPGVVIKSKAFIDSGAVVYPNDLIEEGQKYERFEELLNDRFNFLLKRD